MNRQLGIVLLLVVSWCALPAFGADETDNAQGTLIVRGDMRSAYQALRELQPYLASRERFAAPENEAKIGNLIRQLRSTFHRIDEKQPQATAEPGFVSTLTVMNDLLQDAEARFTEGKKGYAQWRLRTISNHCIACHTRVEAPFEFSDSDPALKGLSHYEKGQFFMATRQFDRAREELLKAAREPEESFDRMSALRQWLVVHTRVKPNPEEALKDLNQLLTQIQLRALDRQEVEGWIASLRKWKAEFDPQEIPSVEKAESLMREALGADNAISGSRGAVELLRATSLLHALLQGDPAPKGEARARMLYLLGMAYSQLPFFFINELPEMFLEQSIRERPNTDTARKAFRRYEELIRLSFTGSGGTHIPSDMRLKLDELHDLAFGVRKLRGAV